MLNRIIYFLATAVVFLGNDLLLSVATLETNESLAIQQASLGINHEKLLDKNIEGTPMETLPRLPSLNSQLLNTDISAVPPLTSLRISQFMNFPPGSTPGNVGIAISGGSSRSMVAGMGQLRGLKALKNARGSLLEQTRAISAVSGGAWLSVPFMYLKNISDQAFLGPYQEPQTYTVDGLQQLDSSNIGARCTTHFSAKDLSFEAVLLAIAEFPSSMIWQTLVGIHILDFYDLYFQSEGLPNSFFSYDQKELKNILNLNASLAQEHVDLVTAEKERTPRPYFICNASMFVNVPKERNQSLVPLQITPFFTGILSTPPNAFDVNAQLVGGGSCTSFAFNSMLQHIDPQKATFLQSRQFSLADAAGVSSSFFAKYLERLAALWNGNLKHFFDDVRHQLHPSHYQHIIDRMPKEKGKMIRELLSKLEKLSSKECSIGNEELLQTGIDPRIFQNALKKLASIVPKYHYWSVHCLTPQKDTIENPFADGGNLENTGISALLLYEDIDNIISFINSSTALSQTKYGIIDPSGREIPGTCIKVSAQIPPLFGYQPYDDKAGYKLYSLDSDSKKYLLKNNQIFPSEGFAELLKGLWR